MHVRKATRAEPPQQATTMRSSERLETVHRMVRERIAFREEDREMAVDLERGIALLDELDPVLDSLD